MIRPLAASALAALVTFAAAPALANATDDVRAAMLKFAALSSYEMTAQNNGRATTMDFVNPGSVHMSSQGVEMIQVGDTTYVKMGGSWHKSRATRSHAPISMGDRIRQLASRANGMSATDLGMKTVGGESLHAYRITSKEGTNGVCYIGRDGLPHRFEGDNAVMTLSKFNAVPPIRAPI